MIFACVPPVCQFCVHSLVWIVGYVVFNYWTLSKFFWVHISHAKFREIMLFHTQSRVLVSSAISSLFPWSLLLLPPARVTQSLQSFCHMQNCIMAASRAKVARKKKGKKHGIILHITRPPPSLPPSLFPGPISCFFQLE